MPGVIWVSFIMDKPLAPACKVYHAHCKEVKDWVMFAGNVATTSGPSISVCREGPLQYRTGGLGGGGVQTTDNISAHQLCRSGPHLWFYVG